MLRLKNIHKKFGANLVYSIDSLELPAGVHWIKGANGSGKSTFLKMLAGMLPFKGEIWLNETSVSKEPVNYRQLINYAPAEPGFPSFLRGDELIEFVKKLKKGNDEQEKEVRNLLAIDRYTANPTGSYSSGMLKKLSLLLAFTGEPKWILLDEPFTTLDQASQLALHKLIQEKNKQGISFILTSHHDMELTDFRFTSIMIMRDKQLLQER